MTEKARSSWYLAWPWGVEEVDDPVTTFHLPEAERRAESMRRVNARGPFPTREEAEERRWRDNVPGYWKAGLTVLAHHCPACGWFAKVLAGCDEAGGWSWHVTDCRRCGIIDSRVRDGLVEP